MKRSQIIIVIAAALAICIGTVVFMNMGSRPTAPSWQEQYDLGVRYLSQGNYQEAIIAFNAAIEINPRQADAYLGLADAYVGMGDMDSAIAVLREGYELTGDERLLRRLEELEALIAAATDTELQDNSVPAEIVDLDVNLTQEQLAMIAPLETAILNMDHEAAFAIAATDEFRSLCEEVAVGERMAYKSDETGTWQLRYSPGERGLSGTCNIRVTFADDQTWGFDCFGLFSGGFGYNYWHSEPGKYNLRVMFDGEKTREHNGPEWNFVSE